MDDGKRISLKIDGRKLQANLVLFQSQSYRILVEDAYGFKNSPISYELRVKPDGFPTIDLLRPTEDLEINGDEVLNLEYSARDDFGLGEINLVVKVGDREEKIRLAKDDTKRLILRDQYKWDLGRLGLRVVRRRLLGSFFARRARQFLFCPGLLLRQSRLLLRIRGLALPAAALLLGLFEKLIQIGARVVRHPR